MILSGVSVTKSNHLYCFFLAFSLDPLESHHTGEQKISVYLYYADYALHALTITLQ